MSDLVLPSFPGLKYPVGRRVLWNGEVQQMKSGKELRASYMSFPIIEYKLSYEFLKSDYAEQQARIMEGFFNFHQGSTQSWLFDDPSDNQAINEYFGTGDGNTTTFQLVKEQGAFSMPVQTLNGTPALYADGVPTSLAFAVSFKGVVTFASPPASGVRLTWFGKYYRRCRFLQSAYDTEEFMQNLWNLNRLEFRTVKL